MENNTININYIDKKDRNEQYLLEMGLFMCHPTDENMKRTFNKVGINTDKFTNYMFFVLLWIIYKAQDNYTDTIAFDGLDVWNMRLYVTDDKAIVFVNDNCDLVMNEDLYNRMSSEIRKSLNLKD